MLKSNKIKLTTLLCYLLALNFTIFSFQLGDGTDKSTLQFIKVFDKAKEVHSDSFTTFVIREDNTLWGTGFQLFKKFGVEGDEIVRSFVKLADDVKFFNGSHLIKTDNTLWQVNNGIKKIDDNVKKVSGNLYIKNDNTLWAYGEDSHGRFGTGNDYSYFDRPQLLRENVIDVYSIYLYTQIVTTKHELWISGHHYLPEPYKISNTFFKVADNVKECTEGFYISVYDELFAFGFSAEGALGIGEVSDDDWRILPRKIMENVESVSSEHQATLILKKDGSLYGCGGKSPNYRGELGFGNLEPVLSPKFIMSDVKKISVGLVHTAIIKKDGTVWTCGENEFPALL